MSQAEWSERVARAEQAPEGFAERACTIRSGGGDDFPATSEYETARTAAQARLRPDAPFCDQGF